MREYDIVWQIGHSNEAQPLFNFHQMEVATLKLRQNQFKMPLLSPGFYLFEIDLLIWSTFHLCL